MLTGKPFRTGGGFCYGESIGPDGFRRGLKVKFRFDAKQQNKFSFLPSSETKIFYYDTRVVKTLNVKKKI